MKLPHEVDSLMWRVAEMGDPKAIADFGRRYPELRGELSKRVAMVQRLKMARLPAAAVIPAFHPLGGAAVAPKLLAKKLLAKKIIAQWIIGAVATASLSVASYKFTTALLTPSQTPMSKGEIVVRPAFRTHRPHGRLRPLTDGYDEPAWKLERDESPLQPTAPAPVQQPQRRITVHTELTTLQALLQTVSEQSGLKIETAPGTLNPELKADYDDASPRDVLNDLGKRCGFTAFDEGDSKILIIPSVDHQKGEGGFAEPPASP